MVAGKGPLSDGLWLFAFQGRLINFEKRRKVSSCRPQVLARMWKPETHPPTPIPVIFGRAGYTGGWAREARAGTTSWEGLFGPSSRDRVGPGRSRKQEGM